LLHKDYCKPLLLDLLVAERAVYEIKVVSAIADSHVGQLLTYLQLLDLRRGKLINFRPARVESRFVNTPISAAEQKSFHVDWTEFFGNSEFSDLVVELLRDWGTALTLSLYQEAVVALLGGSKAVETMLPMQRNGRVLGNQRFLLADPNSAFCLTAMNKETANYQKQLTRLITFSPLRAMHWINIQHHRVTMTTITKP